MNNTTPTIPNLENVLSVAQSELENLGELSEGTLDTLKDHGYSREYIAGFVAGGRCALFTIYSEAIHKAAGGRDEYTALLAWASDSLEPEQRNVFDTEISSGDSLRALAAVRALRQQRTHSTGGA